MFEDKPPLIHILDDQCVASNIEYKHPSNATKGVGVWQDLNGSSTKQISELIEKVGKIHAEIFKSPLPRYLNWIGLRQVIWKSIEYELLAKTLSRKEAAQSVKELYRPLLPRLGCNRNFPLLLQYNPPFLLGLGLHDPYLEQGLLKLTLFVSRGGLETMTGIMILTTLEHHQLAIGFYNPLFHLSYETHIRLTIKTWIICLWEFICKNDITLRNHGTNVGP